MISANYQITKPKHKHMNIYGKTNLSNPLTKPYFVFQVGLNLEVQMNLREGHIR